jgi:Universal stress protein UspA and related nucleotide-binding proteins
MNWPNGLPLVVGVDGSRDSVRALGWALDVAARLGVHVKVLHARGRRHPDTSSSVADGLLLSALAHQVVPSSDVTAADDDAEPVPMLVESGKDACIVVLGARGHGRVAGALTGSVSQHVAALAPCPVVVVREPADSASRTVVLGVDETADEPACLSPGSRDAAGFAFWFANGMSAPLTVLRAWQDAYLDRSGIVLPLNPELAAEDRSAAIRELDRSLADLVARYPGVVVSRDVRPRHPQRLLVDASEHAGLVVVGSRGRGAVAGMLLGSVSQALLQHAACPVAVVR